jgi:hypothetical protein
MFGVGLALKALWTAQDRRYSHNVYACGECHEEVTRAAIAWRAKAASISWLRGDPCSV